MFVLFNILVGAAIGFVFGLIGMQEAGMVVSWLYSLAALLPGLGVFVRRLHDTGRSGWWWLIAFLPVLGAIVLFVFMCLDSQPGENKYGPNPKA